MTYIGDGIYFIKYKSAENILKDMIY